MRIIKFRAWCEEDKVMIYDLNSPRLQHGELKDDMYEFMQFTGLYDSKGKEIYEGDILQWTTGARDIVTWNEDGFLRNWDFLPSGKIIGNIYENPELLENK
jgi:hypothetical protein